MSHPKNKYVIRRKDNGNVLPAYGPFESIGDAVRFAAELQLDREVVDRLSRNGHFGIMRSVPLQVCERSYAPKDKPMIDLAPASGT
ncbi:hypothetical protein ACQUFY_05815 [Robbsia andropogonis]|uniref:hypothetical protein n=1 Tax=Robbsia andropogonis TaxID=28092 RepID=UPI003D247FD4